MLKKKYFLLILMIVAIMSIEYSPAGWHCCECLCLPCECWL